MYKLNLAICCGKGDNYTILYIIIWKDKAKIVKLLWQSESRCLTLQVKDRTNVKFKIRTRLNMKSSL